MKQSKKLLSVLLALFMALSCLTVGASAYRTEYYNNPAGYNNLNQPYFTVEQTATSILDDFNAVIKTYINKTFTIDELGITVTINSIDSAFDFIYDIYSSGEYALLKEQGAIKDGDLGDLDAFDKTIPMDKSIRRSSKTMSDFEYIDKVLEFVSVNSDVLAKFISGTFDLGFISKYWNLNKTLPQFKDFHKWVMDKVYNEVMYSNRTNPNATLDETVQEFINTKCISYYLNMLGKSDGTNVIANYFCLSLNSQGKIVKDGTQTPRNIGILDVCPSLTASQIDYTKLPFVEFVRRIVNALIKDQIIPIFPKWEIRELGVNPNATSFKFKEYLDAIGLFMARTSQYIETPSGMSNADILTAFFEFNNVPNPSKPTAMQEMQALVNFLCNYYFEEVIYFKVEANGTRHLIVNPDLASQVKTGVLAALAAVAEAKDELPIPQSVKDAINGSKDDEGSITNAIVYLYKQLYSGVMGEDIFPENVTTIKEVLTYTLANLAADLVPEADFYAEIESGKLNPDSADSLRILVVLAEYYLCKHLGMEKTTTADHIAELGEVTEKAFMTFLSKYLCLFNVFQSEADVKAHGNDIWYILYYSINQWIPFTTLFVGIEDSPTGLKTLVMDKILPAIKHLDINGLCSVLGTNSSKELMKPLSQILVNFIARVMNGMFKLPSVDKSNLNSNAEQLKLVVPYSYTKLDQLIANENTDGVNNGTGFANTVKNIFKYAPALNIEGETKIDGFMVKNSTFANLLPVEFIIQYGKDYEYMVQYMSKNITSKGITYSKTELIDKYNELKGFDNKNNSGVEYDNDAYTYFYEVDYTTWAYHEFTVARDNAAAIVNGTKSATAAEITKAYVALTEYYRLLNENKIEANDYQLNKAVTYAVDNFGEANDDGSGTPKFTADTWEVYDKALTFANAVEEEVATCNQSKVNEARRQLVSAMEQLEEYVGPGDYSNLELQLTVVESIEVSPYAYTEDSLNALLSAYDDAKALDETQPYDAASQDKIDEVTDALIAALAALERKPYIEFANEGETKQYIDFKDGFVYGFNKPIWTYEDRLNYDNDFETYFGAEFGAVIDGINTEKVTGTVSMKLVPAEEKGDNAFGTAAKVQIFEVETEKVLAEYTIIVFGDVNSDAVSDSFDSSDFAVVASAKDIFEGVYAIAGDLQGTFTVTDEEDITETTTLHMDGVTDVFDFSIQVSAASGKSLINQNPSDMLANQLTFAELLGVTAE
ncbi:MAG: hypothetical protein KBT46_06735 [Ruminococcus sp.]|nr:hypothetical protein [Candidatus Copronaster equi]